MKTDDDRKEWKKPRVGQTIRMYCAAKWFHISFRKSSVFIGIMITIVIVIMNLTNSKQKTQDFPQIIYYMRHFQAKHNVDGKYLQVLDPDLTEFGFQQDLFIVISRRPKASTNTIHEIGEIPADTARSKEQLKQKFPELSSIIDRDLVEGFNDKNNSLYKNSLENVKQRISRFHQRLWEQRKEKHILIITHAGWLTRALNQREPSNGEIIKKIYTNSVV
ncbi:unnamed protein product [Adineta ricciae]|uniref:Phosphoglycerate mutase-like protein n=1 Tax=Adineta ricciae TaxID=249248 RepID=A0A814YZJ9_ADIRI|nr:unnamed protein product [Adineta ricciae]